MYQTIKTKFHDAVLWVDAKWDALPQEVRTDIISAWNTFMTGFLGTIAVAFSTFDPSMIEKGAILGVFIGAINTGFRAGLKSLFAWIGSWLKNKISTIKILSGKK